MAPEKVLVPVLAETIAPFVAVPPLAITLATVIFPAPAKVKVRPAELFAGVRSIPPLNTNDPPETVDQVASPPELITLLPKVWIAVELFVIPPTFPTVISVPVQV